MRRTIVIACAGSLLASCGEFAKSSSPDIPTSQGEDSSGYSYVPLDPLPVTAGIDKECKGQYPPVLSRLPDTAVRIAVRQLSGKGKIGFGPAQLGAEGNSYQIILDYINADVVNIPFKYRGGDLAKGIAPTQLTRIEQPTRGASDELVIPVYVGIGLRLTANVTVRKGTVNLGSLGALAAAAEAEQVTGSLIVQTLGITGKQVTSSLPLPSELNPTTIQNAIQALGAVKAIVYDQANTVVTPRVTGIYNPLPTNDQRTVNQIVSQLALEPIPWWYWCL
jgi:hypothetical protein